MRIAVGPHLHIFLGSIAVTHLIVLHHVRSGKALVGHAEGIVEEVLVRHAGDHCHAVAVEIAVPVGGDFEELVEGVVSTAACLLGTGRIGVDDTAIIVIVVVPFLDCSEAAHLQALDGLDVHRGLDAAAEEVAHAVGFLLVHVLHRVHESGFLGTPEIAVGGGFIVDGIGRIQQGRILEVAAEIVVAVAHVAEVVLEVDPSVKSLLAGGQLCHQFAAVGSLGDTLGILEVDGCAVVELPGGAYDGHVVVVGDCGGAADFRHPVGVVALTVGTGVDVGRGQAAGKGCEIPEFLSGSHAGARVADGGGGVSRILHPGVGHVGERISALGGDDDDAIGTAGAVDSGGGAVLKHVHGCDFVRRDVVDIADRNAVHDEQGAGAGSLVEGGEAADLDVVTGAGRVGSGLDDVETRDLALEQSHGVGLDTGIEILALDGSDGSGNLFLFLGTITDDHDLVEEGGVVGKVDGLGHLGGLEGLGCISDAAHLHRGVGAGDGEHEITVKAGGYSVGRALFEHGGSVDGPQGIHDDALDLVSLCGYLGANQAHGQNCGKG